MEILEEHLRGLKLKDKIKKLKLIKPTIIKKGTSVFEMKKNLI